MFTKYILRAVSFLLFILLNNQLSAQQVSGTVMDKTSHEPIAFVSIINLKTKALTKTDLQGKFSIEGKGDTLEISIFGFVSQKMLGANDLEIILELNTILIGEVVITASRNEEKRAEVPVAISTISSQTIEDNKPSNINEVLNQTPGVYMVDLGNEQHSMSIRQPISTGAVYLYLEDGLPVRPSGVYNHNSLLEMNMANVDKVEVIRGPASSMYGAEAIGGAVNFITLKPSSVPTAKVGVRGNNLGYKRTDFGVSNTIHKLGFGINGYYAQRRNGYRDHSDFDKMALSLNLTYKVTKYSELLFSSTYVDYDSDASGSLDSTDFYEKKYNSIQTFTNREVNALRAKLQFDHYWRNGSKSTIASFFRNNSIKQIPHYRIKDDYRPWSGSGDPNLAHGEQNDNSVKSYGFVAQHAENFKNKKMSALGGLSLDYSPASYEANYISIYKNDDDVYGSFTPKDSLLADYTVGLVNVGAYAQVAYKPIKNLKVVAGLRFDNFLYNYKTSLDSNAFSGVPDSKDSYSRFTPKFGLTYDLKKNRGVYANYSQGFVPPQVGELYRGVKSPELGPALYDSYEFGGWIGFAKKKGRIDASIYRMEGTNEIISVRKDDGTIEKDNAGKTRHQGIEYSIQYEIKKGLTFRFSGSNAQHKFIEYVVEGTDYSSNSMPGSPGWIANSQITYKPTSFLKGFRVSLEWQHLDSYYMESANTKEYEGYDLLNLRLGYKYKSFDFWVNLMNVTNELYATNASAGRWGDSYTPGEPVNVNVGVGYKFKKKKKTPTEGAK